MSDVILRQCSVGGTIEELMTFRFEFLSLCFGGNEGKKALRDKKPATAGPHNRMMLREKAPCRLRKSPG